MMPCLSGSPAARRVGQLRHAAPHSSSAAALQKHVPRRGKVAASGSPAVLMPTSIRRLAPSSDMDATEQAIKVLGEVSHSGCEATIAGIVCRELVACQRSS
jgi:hypothetical protein